VPYVLNDPEDFVDEATEGFVAAHSHLVRRVQGGVVRNQEKTQGHVAVVIGGGSGHYPAFAGIVGPGLAHGAVVGNVFSSPSTQRVHTVCKAAESGGGVLLSYGNYAGDVMNFNLAQSQLNAEGIPCKTVLVTDDIMSASKEEFHKRRGIAGDLFVFKVAAAAAETGYSLDEVYRVAVEANERTRTIGVAFSGCTLPGKTEPLFTVPKGRMALGLGIHGEPGLSESDIPTSKELALELVTHLLDETPDSCRKDSKIRLCVLVNGLGGVKYEELYVLYNNIFALLKEKDIEIVEPEIGELVTSFEMAGASLTFTWLNDELEDFWKKPTYTPGYKKGTVSLASSSSQSNSSQEEKKVISKGSAESQECAKNVLKILQLMETNTAQRADEYGLLDSYAGDGDHGIGMARGAHAAASAAKQYVDAGAGAGSTLEGAADSWSDKAGGTSGIIWGIILREIGKEFGDSVKPSAHVVASAVARASAEVTKFGKAQIGDKTLVDVLIPFSQKLVSENGKSLPEAWRSASGIAANSAADTANLLPKIGRARPHAEKSLGHQDPGATSLAMIISTIANFLEGK
jgi:dihydroxyacetone kinase